MLRSSMRVVSESSMTRIGGAPPPRLALGGAPACARGERRARPGRARAGGSPRRRARRRRRRERPARAPGADGARRSPSRRAGRRRWPRAPARASNDHRRTRAARRARGDRAGRERARERHERDDLAPSWTIDSPSVVRATSSARSGASARTASSGMAAELPARLDDERVQRGDGHRDDELDASCPRAAAVRTTDVATEALGRLAHHVEPHAPTRDLGDHGGRREAALRGAAGRSSSASRARALRPAEDPCPLRARRAHRLHVDAPPVVLAGERDDAPPALDVELARARRRLARRPRARPPPRCRGRPRCGRSGPARPGRCRAPGRPAGRRRRAPRRRRACPGSGPRRAPPARARRTPCSPA